MFGIEEHLVVEPCEDIALFDLAHGRALRVDEADLNADAGRHRGVSRLDARANIEAGVSDLVGGGSLGGGGLIILILGLHRTDEPGEQEHVEGNLAEGVHGRSFKGKRRWAADLFSWFRAATASAGRSGDS